MLTLGFVGTGALSEAIVRGLERAAPGRYRVLLSPRSANVSLALAEAFPTVRRAGGNDEVVAGSDIVFLGVLPPQLADVTAGLPFRPDQTVVSLVAGVPLETVSSLVAPARAVCRVIPMPPVRINRGPILLHPPIKLVESVLQPLGDLIPVESETTLTTFTLATALMSSFFALQNETVAWLQTRGEGDAAGRFVTSMFDGLAALAVEELRAGHSIQPDEHETKGGLNETVRRHLTAEGWLAEIGAALDHVARHRLT